MTAGAWSGLGSILPRERRPSTAADPLIQEARDRQRRRKRFIVLVVVVVLALAMTINHSARLGRASLTQEASSLSKALPTPCSLLTDAQVAPTIGGTVARRSAAPTWQGHICTWLSPPMGFMQNRSQLTLAIYRETKPEFIGAASANAKARPRFGAVPVVDLGESAFRTPNWSGVRAWRNGVVVAVTGDYLAAYPATGPRLLRAVLREIEHVR